MTFNENAEVLVAQNYFNYNLYFNLNQLVNMIPVRVFYQKEHLTFILCAAIHFRCLL